MLRLSLKVSKVVLSTTVIMVMYLFGADIVWLYHNCVRFVQVNIGLFSNVVALLDNLQS